MTIGKDSYLKQCPCESDETYTWEVYDARGIYVTRVCHECHKERLAGFRPEIFTDPNY